MPKDYVIAALIVGTLSCFGSVATAAEQIDLVSAQRSQETRLQELQRQVDAARTAGNDAEADALDRSIDTVRREDLWSATSGAPALTLDTASPSNVFHPFSFAVLSDLHLSERNGPQRFERALELIGKRHDIAFVIVLGDIVWDRDPQKLKGILAAAKVPVHLVYGNNDWKWLANGSYEKAFVPRDYTFTCNNCTFICMYDCLPKGNFPEDHKGDFKPEQWTWLEQQLQAAKDAHAAHIFTAMHIPPATPGAFDPWFMMYTNTEKRFFELMEKYDVSCCLFGHLHQNAAWKHDNIQCYVTPSCCWNFISRTQKVDSSFCRIVKVEQDKISDALLPVRLDGETFAWETLSNYYDPTNHPN